MSSIVMQPTAQRPPAVSQVKPETGTGLKPEPEPHEKTQEVRLGLVLYGGVSLAIYINGVCHEFFRAVHGRGIYKLLKVLTDSEVIVDVVSGTSAGGINGILLAFALCNDREFADTGSLWRRDGGISQLLRNPGRNGLRSLSVLDSEGYYQSALESAFKYMGPYTREPGEEYSKFGELDLFVTGTDVDGNVYTRFDDAGHPIDVKDHRTVFLLKHRAGRRNPFDPKPEGIAPALAAMHESVTYEALAKLARITSCFPAAFAPVRVHVKTDSSLSADARLQEWGRIQKEACFLDGGVLDNKPFTHTLGAIFTRHADREVDRKLFYVEPDPETFKPHLEATEPDFFQAITASMIGIPGYESISDDLKMIAEHNNKVEQYHRIISNAKSVQDDEDPDRARANRKLYQSSRMVALSERVIQGLLRKNGRDDLLDPKQRQAAAKLVEAFDKVEDRGEILEEFDVYFHRRRLYYVTNAIYRKLYHDPAKEMAGDPLVSPHRTAWQALNRQSKLLEIIQMTMERVIDEAPIKWQDGRPAEAIWGDIRKVLRTLLDDTERPFATLPKAYSSDTGQKSNKWLSQATLKLFKKEISDRADDIIEKVRTASSDTGPLVMGPKDGGSNLLLRADRYSRQIIDALLPADDVIRRAYETFELLDERVFPVEVAAGLREKEKVTTVRISPRDAEQGFSRHSFSDKVAGDAFYHFGGFFKRSWRSNDILWGRLDGLCQLVESLLPIDRLEAVMKNVDLRRQIQDRLFTDPDRGIFRAEFDPAMLFPQAGESTQRTLARWLRDLVGEDEARRQEALRITNRNGGEAQSGGYTQALGLLIEAAQLEVIRTDLPNVITDAIEEQAEWHQVPVRDDPTWPRRGPPENWVFKPLEPTVDPFVATVAAAERMRAAIGDLSDSKNALTPRDTALGRFFVDSYRVGKERLTSDIPPFVLMEILAVALLLVRDCILTAMGERGERLRRNKLYRFTVALPLQVFHFLVSRRRTSRLRKALFMALGVVCLLVLAWAVTTVVSNVRITGSVPWGRVLTFGGASVVILAIQSFILRYSRMRFSEYAPTVELAITQEEEDSWLDGSFMAECSMRGKRMDVRLRGGAVQVRVPEEQRDPIKLRSIRVGLARHESEVTSTVPGESPLTYVPGQTSVLVAESRRDRVGVEVGATGAVPLGRHNLSLKIPKEISLDEVWLVVEMEVERGPKSWWRPWRSERQVSMIHACRRMVASVQKDKEPKKNGQGSAPANEKQPAVAEA